MGQASESGGTRTYARPTNGSAVSDLQTDEHGALLLARMARGDERAASQLYDLYSPRLFGLALAMLRERAHAEEVVSDTFVQAWRTAGTFDFQRGSVSAWLTMMVRSRSLDCIRARSRRARAEERACAETMLAEAAAAAIHESQASEAMEREEMRAWLFDALRQLPPEQREVVELSFFGGASHTRVAEHLGLPLGTVKTRARSALQRMRAMPMSAGLR